MKRIITNGLAAVLIMTLLSACGGGPTDTTGQTNGTSAQTGESQSVEFQFTTDDGTQVDGTASTGVPDDFPLPVYPEWAVMAAAAADIGGGIRWNASFQFEGDVGQLVEKYAGDLESLGYEVSIMELTSDMYGIEVAGTLDGKPVDGVISIGNAGDMRVININFGHPM